MINSSLKIGLEYTFQEKFRPSNFVDIFQQKLDININPVIVNMSDGTGWVLYNASIGINMEIVFIAIDPKYFSSWNKMEIITQKYFTSDIA